MKFRLATLLLAVLLSACAAQAPRRTAVVVQEDPHAHYRATHGRVTTLERIEERGGTSGAGAVVGGVAGGVIGHQVGKGSGRDVATVVGAVGGALIGNEVERQNTAPKIYYRVTVRLDNGATRVVNQGSIGDLAVGDHVRIDHNQAIRD